MGLLEKYMHATILTIADDSTNKGFAILWGMGGVTPNQLLDDPCMQHDIGRPLDVETNHVAFKSVRPEHTDES